MPKRLQNGPRSEQTVKDTTQTQGKSFLLRTFTKGRILGRVLCIPIHSLIKLMQNQTALH